MKEPVFLSRPLIEVQLSKEELNEEFQKIVDWLEENSTAAHAEQDEYFMWIPPTEEYLQEYKDMPEEIREIIITVIGHTRGQEDQGYLLIVIS